MSGLCKNIICILISLLAISNVSTAQKHMVDYEWLLSRCKASYDTIKNYQCSFHKKELIRDEMRQERNIMYKFMKPDHYYMKWTEGENENIETLYVEGKNDNEMMVHLNGLLGFLTVSADPRGSSALKNNRHPITESGMGHILNLFDGYYKKSKVDEEIKLSGDTGKLLNGKKMIYIKAVFPSGKGYYGNEVEIYFDPNIFLPVKIIVHGWRGEFLEEYYFENIRINCGLTQYNFDPENPEYDF